MPNKRVLVAVALLGYLGLSQAFAQPDSQEPHSSTSDNTQLPSAKALGDVFFKSRDSFIFSVGIQQSATNNLYFSPVSFVSQGTDDNRYLPFTTLTSRVAFQRQLPRASVGLDYQAAGILFRDRDSSSFLTQHGGIDLAYRASPRSTFAVGDRISVTPAPGRFYQGDSILSPSSAAILPNSTLFVSLNRTISNAAYASYSYDLSRRSLISFGAQNTITRFQQQGLSEMNQSGGHMAYSYRVAEKTTLTLGYHFAYYDFANPRSADFLRPSGTVVRSHWAYVGITQRLTSSVSAFLQAGPNYLVGNAIGELGTFSGRPGVRVSVNGGLIFSEAIALDPRTFFSISAGQTISDGYGLGAVTETQQAGVSLGRRLTKTLTGSVNGSYARNRFLLNTDERGKPITTNGVSGGANLSLNLTERVNLFANHTYFRQLSTGFYSVIPGRASGNTFTVGLNYSLAKFF
ncbi:MAG: hypothetical protein AB1898_19345 [Acidobacteriota bacterium]